MKLLYSFKKPRYEELDEALSMSMATSILYRVNLISSSAEVPYHHFFNLYQTIGIYPIV